MTLSLKWAQPCILGLGTFCFSMSTFSTTLECIKAMGSAGDRRLEQLRHAGSHTLAYATLQVGMKYFDTPRGYVAYDESLGVEVVLGDPISAEEDRNQVLDLYIEEHPKAIFAHITELTAVDLAARGFRISELGEDSRIDLRTYNFIGPKKSKFRQASRAAEEKGFRILELDESEVNWSSVQAITEEWRQRQVVKGREVRFLNRPIVYENEIDVRKFYMVSELGDFVSFVFFDPIYNKGQIIGYSPSIKRRSSRAPTGAEEATVKHAIETFQSEGREVLTLGLSPLSNLENNRFRTNQRLNYVLKLIRKYGDGRIYSFKGHEDFKHRYRGIPFKVYYASQKNWNGRQLVALMRVSNIFP